MAVSRAEAALLGLLPLAVLGCDRTADGLDQPAAGQAARADAVPAPRWSSARTPAQPSGRAVADKDFGTFIVRGEAVPPGGLRYVVGLTRGLAREPSCTGTLIREDVVLTAAHCLCPHPLDGRYRLEDRSTNVFVGNDPLRVGEGKYYRIVAAEVAMQCWSDAAAGMDLGLARLVNPVANVTVPGFAADTMIDGARSYRIAGFGATNLAGTAFTHRKLQAPVPSVSNACRGSSGGVSDSQLYGCQPGEEIVAGNRVSPDTCRGDSGGPLLVGANGTGTDSAYRLAGVTSGSVAGGATSCGSGGIYERLTPRAREWIRTSLARLGG